MIPSGSKKSIVFVGGESGLIRSYDYRKGHVVKTFAGHKRAVTALAAGGGNEAYFVSGSKDKSVRIWRCDTQEAVATLRGHSQTVTSVAVYEVATIATGCDDGKLRIFSYDSDTSESNMAAMVNFTAEKDDAGASEKKGGKKKKGKKKEQEAVEAATPDRSSQVLAVAISAKLIAAGRSALCVAVLNHAGVVLCDIAHEGWVYSCRFARPDRLITGSSDGATRVWDVATCLAACDAKKAPSPALELPTESAFQGNRSWIMDVVTDADHKFVCSAQRDGDVAVWKVPDEAPFYASDPAQLLRVSEQRDDADDHPEPNAVAINWNGTLVCCPYSDGFLRIYKLGAKPSAKAVEPEMTEEDVAALKFQKLTRGKKARRTSAIGSVLPSMRPPDA